jgi:hypothetical protein
LGETRKGEVVQQVSEWVSDMTSDLGTMASSEPEEEEESGTPEEFGAGLQMREGGGGEHPAVDDSSTSVGERIVLNLLEHTQSVLAALLLVNTTGRESSFGMFPLKDWDHGLGQGGGFGAGGIDLEKVFPELKTAVYSFCGI